MSKAGTIAYMSELWSITVPGWLTGVGTLALAATTVYLTNRERSDRRRLEARELDDRQRLEAAANDRGITERRRQASSVSAWHAGVVQPESQGEMPQSRIALSNRSDEPVYNVVVILVLIQGAGPRTGEQLVADDSLVSKWVRLLGVVPPGLWQVRVDGDWGGMYRAPGAELGFTDRSGVFWIRRADGELMEIDANAIDHYGLTMPLSMTDPEEFAG